MKETKLTIEKAVDGTLWGRLKHGDDLLTSAASTEKELQENFKQLLHELYDVDPKKIHFKVQYDLAAFFDTIEALNISAIGKLAGINPALMRHYKTGIKNPSAETLVKIEKAIHELANDLKRVSFMKDFKIKKSKYEKV